MKIKRHSLQTQVKKNVKGFSWSHVLVEGERPG